MEVLVYRACDYAQPGALAPLARAVPHGDDLPRAALEAMVSGVTDQERERGCTSYFSAATADAVQAVEYSAGGDTMRVAFSDFSAAIPDVPGNRSFLPPGIMAELTWTIFQQFPGIQAMELSFDGDQAAFWSWVTGRPSEPQVLTRELWEQV